MSEQPGRSRRRITLELSLSILEKIDAFKAEWGLRSRGDIVERLLEQLFDVQDEEPEDGEEANGATFNETSAIVLVGRKEDENRDQELDPFAANGTSAKESGRLGGGIELPGFVRKQGQELRRSLDAKLTPAAPAPMALIHGIHLEEALNAARSHWIEVYGTAATAQVDESAMVWLAKEIWPRCDQSDGRLFTWSLAVDVVRTFAPQWPIGESNFERAIVAAGVMEDPFSGSSLVVRVPTLITRFMQWARSRHQRGNSFLTVESTMTVLTALKLLQLPTAANHAMTLQEIREAYRDQAQQHHPDAGGSADAMRRLNEAYQLLKERYRRR